MRRLFWCELGVLSRTIKPGITVTGKVPRAERPLPTLPPDELSNCYEGLGRGEVHIVREACVNTDKQRALQDYNEAIKLAPVCNRIQLRYGANEDMCGWVDTTTVKAAREQVVL